MVRLREQASVKYDMLGSTNQNKQTVKVLKVMVYVAYFWVPKLSHAVCLCYTRFRLTHTCLLRGVSVQEKHLPPLSSRFICAELQMKQSCAANYAGLR